MDRLLTEKSEDKRCNEKQDKEARGAQMPLSLKVGRRGVGISCEAVFYLLISYTLVCHTFFFCF